MDWCWSPSSSFLATWGEEVTPWKRPWCWERLKVAGEQDNRGWDDWMASPTWWTWVWVSSRSWWRIGRPGMLQSMGSQRVGHDWVTEQQLATSTSSLERCLFKSFVHYWTGLFVLFLLSFRSSLHVLNYNHFSGMWLAKILFHSLGCLFSLPIVSLDKQNF